MSPIDRSHSNVGAIVGGTVGGVVGLAALILALIFWRRRSNFHKQQKDGPVDLLREGDDDDHHEAGQLPRYYEPEPFMVPDPTVASSSAGDPSMSAYNAPSASLRPSGERRASHYSGTEAGRSATPDGVSAGGSTYMRKSPLPPVFRPVNIVQHEDAGPGEDEEHAETIELPPAYTNIKTKAAAKEAGDETPESAAGGSSVGLADTSLPAGGSSSPAPARASAEVERAHEGS